MQVTLVLKDWRVAQDDKTKSVKIKGKYAVMMGDKEIALQAFNDGYSEKEIPFSGDTVQAIMGVEALIRAELEKLLA